ncbi:MAG: histidine kinase [Cyclobacteriaceae bacterium]
MLQFQRSRGEVDWGRALSFAGIQMSFAMAVAYLNFFIFLPRFLKSKNVWKYILEFGIPFAILITARVILQRYLVDDYTHRAKYFYSTTYVVELIAGTLFIAIFISMIRFAAEWFELESRRREVENEKLTAELNFLKAQINPHFLFNTLNNLYYLAYTQSPNTTEVVAKLSQMMRYMIYDSNYPLVRLNKEIEYMQNYISLERLRLNNQIPVRFDVDGVTEDVQICPLILITFLENAFKHGVSSDAPGSWVNLLIKVTGSECLFVVENSKRPESQRTDGKSGIGLQNVQRRLHLSYPEKHTLVIRNTEDQYRVELKIDLA